MADGRPPVEENTDGGFEAVRHLKDAVARGSPWDAALLEAISLWTLPEESLSGHRYVYLIDGEAFDWLLLAERLCGEIREAIPEGELRDLLFSGRLPREVSEEEFAAAIGSAKYHAYLNFFYGVTVERFVLIAVEEEVWKERQSYVFSGRDDAAGDAHQRVYGVGQEDLLDQFRSEKHYERAGGIGVDELQEFTYWLFKYRLRTQDRERVASDTAKGIAFLRRQWAEDGGSIPHRLARGIVEHGA
jgi:hypothetical protein